MADRVRKNTRTGKHVCDVCKQEFARADHLNRHSLLHSGVRPYSCTFCNELFGRCDSLRRHYSGCAKRGDREIPETDHKGRRRHACQPLRCEGTSPCKSCVRRGTPCVKLVAPKKQKPKTNAHLATNPGAVDPGSIKFLLNAGEAGFIADWRMPDGSVTPRARSIVDQPANDYASSYIGQSVANYHFDPATSGLLQAFEDGPWDSYRAGQENQQPPNTAIIWPLVQDGQSIWSGNLVGDDSGLDGVVASALINVLTSAVPRLASDSKTHQILTADVNFLMTPPRIRRFIDSYQSIWHFNCPIVHVADFAPENVQLALLLPIVLMGALYTSDERELAAAKNLLDIAELYCFSSDVLSPEAEIRRSMEGGQSEATSDWAEFQQLQGAYLTVAMQFWAGNQPARNRAMECRFSEVIKLVRSMSLNKVVHQTEDQYNQELWIRRECKIRTMNILFCLDCAFLFFRSYPCRLSFTELDFELPCEEPVFNSRHPFQHPRFGRRLPITLKQGVEALSKAEPLFRDPDAEISRFTMLSMFILIHMLYAFISNRLSLPWLNGGTRTADDPTSSGCDSFLSKIKITLDRWSEYWAEVMATVTPDAWQMSGLFRNGNKYHMVAQLLVAKHEVIEGDELMVPKCEDKWARMRALT